MMATPGINWGPAQELGDDYTAAMQKLSAFLQMMRGVPTPHALAGAPQPDTSWHDAMVKKANQAFADADNRRRAGAKKLGSVK